METEIYTRTTTETAEGVLLTEENIFEAAKLFTAMDDVHSVTTEIGSGATKVRVYMTVVPSSIHLAPGDIVDIRGKVPRKVFPRSTRTEWQAS